MVEDETARSSATVHRKGESKQNYVSFAAGESPRDWPEWKVGEKVRGESEYSSIY